MNVLEQLHAIGTTIAAVIAVAFFTDMPLVLVLLQRLGERSGYGAAGRRGPDVSPLR